MSGKLLELGKEKESEDVRDWIQSTVNHLFWTAATSKSGDETVAK